jgi:hypothetical protein
MPALHRESGDDDLRTTGRYQVGFRQTVTYDLAVGLDVEPSAPDGDTGTTPAPRFTRSAKPLIEIGLAVRVSVSQRHDVSTGWRAARGVVGGAPGVDVHVAVGSDREVAGSAQVLREHGRCKSRRQLESHIGCAS